MKGENGHDKLPSRRQSLTAQVARQYDWCARVVVTKFRGGEALAA